MKNILFDLDGTLTDPFIGICSSVRYSLNKVGIETRVGCNLAGMWSIYVISVPEKLIGTSMKF